MPAEAPARNARAYATAEGVPKKGETMKCEEEMLIDLLKAGDGGMQPKFFTRATPIVAIDDCHWKLEGLEVYAFRDPEKDKGWTIEDRTNPDAPFWICEGIVDDDKVIEWLLMIHRARIEHAASKGQPVNSESEVQGSAKPSVLAALQRARVMVLEKNEAGRFVLTEGCDGYFELELSADELIALADELRSIAAGSPPIS